MLEWKYHQYVERYIFFFVPIINFFMIKKNNCSYTYNLFERNISVDETDKVYVLFLDKVYVIIYRISENKIKCVCSTYSLTMFAFNTWKSYSINSPSNRKASFACAVELFIFFNMSTCSTSSRFLMIISIK